MPELASLPATCYTVFSRRLPYGTLLAAEIASVQTTGWEPIREFAALSSRVLVGLAEILRFAAAHDAALYSGQNDNL